MLYGIFFIALFAFGLPAHALNQMVFEDIFGRRLNERGMTLVDWEGQIANPVIRLLVIPPSDAAYPASGTISSTEARLYFDLPSTASAAGPSKLISFPNSMPVPVLVSIFPDRDMLDEIHTLTVVFTSNGGTKRTQTLGVRVIDQDKSLAPVFNVNIDYSRDATGFFASSPPRNIVTQAAQDWAYFFADMNLDIVQTGAEETYIWNVGGFTSGNYVKNSAAYRGFLLYVYGIKQQNPPYRSGGSPSFTGGFQSSGGIQLPIKRSGGHELEVQGNYNTLGWYLTTGDSDWWIASNLGYEQNDLYSVSLHEIGHSLIFNSRHTIFGNFKAAGTITNEAVVAYQGAAPAINSSDHLIGTIDRLSRKGAFGHDYYGDVPARRWTITKLDLLVAQAIGYNLRSTSAFIPLSIGTTALPRGAVGNYYSQALSASGGIPFYEWTIIAGALPGGLMLDSFTGEIRGVPPVAGMFNFTVRLRDYDMETPPVDLKLSISVGAVPFRITSLDRDGANVLVRFNSSADRRYRIEFKNNLLDATWSVLAASINGTGASVTVIDNGAASLPKRFYRAVEL